MSKQKLPRQETNESLPDRPKAFVERIRNGVKQGLHNLRESIGSPMIANVEAADKARPFPVLLFRSAEEAKRHYGTVFNKREGSIFKNEASDVYQLQLEGKTMFVHNVDLQKLQEVAAVRIEKRGTLQSITIPSWLKKQLSGQTGTRLNKKN